MMIIRKTEKVKKRRVFVWELLEGRDETVLEYIRTETWWLLWIIPVYSRDTIIGRN